jgi:predicted site-specific integrase-resolvase
VKHNVIAIDQPRYVKPEVVAQIYGVSKVTILRWARKGTIPSKRGMNGAQRGIWMFDLAAVDAALDRNAAQVVVHRVG